MKMIRFIAGFFKNDSAQSMMRLLSFLLVVFGLIIVWVAVYLELSGAHYGLELACLGVLGKGYQKGVEKR